MNEGTQNGEARVESGCEKQKRGAGAKRMRMGDSVRPDLSALYASSDPLRSFKPVSFPGDLGPGSHQE